MKKAWLNSPLGPILAIADEEALLLLEFQERKGLKKELDKLSRHSISEGWNAPLKSIDRELRDYFSKKLTTFKTPIKLQGTLFQQKVWRQLQQIPLGETLSYKELAEAVGNPKGCRAVAQANGANQLAILIPCHRVINTGGKLGGYGAGLEKKQWLLNHER